MDSMEREIRRAERRRHDCEQLGAKSPRCLKCGENRTECLELHHIGGEAYDAEKTVLLCRNCHAVETDRQQHEAPEHAGDPSNALASSANRLLGWARLLAAGMEALDEEARELIILSRVFRI